MNAEKVEFSQSRNDMHWKLWAGDDKFIRWSGYDDNYWWDNVSPTAKFRERTGVVTGRTFTLDPETNEVTIMEKAA
jgi:hypothetical protein